MTMQLVLIVRRPPGRPRLYRFDADDVTVGSDPTGDLVLDDPRLPSTALVFRAEAGRYLVSCHAPSGRLGGRPVPADVPTPVATADAIELGDWLVEIALEYDAAPITDRQERRRLDRVLAAERAVEAVGGPSVWVLRGQRAGAALPVGFSGVSCGSGPSDDLRLMDEGVEPGHFTLTADPDGAMRLAASRPVRVRGRPVRSTALVSGDLIFVGEAVCEVRAAPPARPVIRRRAAPAPNPRALIALVAVALGALAVAWWSWWFDGPR